MKKTRLISLLKNIWTTKTSYLSILVFVGLGIGIFLGIKWNQPAFLNTADRYYSEYELYDYNIKFPFGITVEDVEVIRSIDEVSLLEAGYTAEGTTGIGGKNYVLSLVSLTESMNLATAVEGVLPQMPNEIGIEQNMADAAGLRIGDTVKILSRRAKGMDESFLKETEFTVTSIVEHPAYIRSNASRSRGLSSVGDGMVDFYVLLSPDAFDTEAYDNCYSNVYIRCDSLRGLNSFGEEYRAKLDEIAVALEETGKVRGSARAEEVRGRIEEEMSDARDRIDLGEEELAEAEAKVAQGEKDIAEAEQRIAEAETDIASGEKELEEARKELAAGEQELRAAKTRYNSAKREYDAMDEKVHSSSGYHIDQLIAMYQNAPESTKDRIRQYGDVDSMVKQKKKLDSAEREIRNGEWELAMARTKIAEGETELEAAKQETAAGKEELARYKLELEDAKKKIAEGTTELEDGRLEMEAAEDMAEKLMVYQTWMLEKRTGNLSYHISEVYSEIGQQLCYSLALLFVFVGIMISYTSIARIVQEQRPLVGVQKSLGFTRREITSQYMAYAISAVILGGILGGTLGYFVIEKIMNGAFEKNHIIGPFIPYFSWADLLTITLIEMLLIGLASWLGCRRHLIQPAIRLMQKGTGAGRGRTRFYEKWDWWKSRSLYTQTIINNLMSDRNRIIATLVGVVGCTSLLVMALGVQASIRNTPEKHFDRVWTYDARLIFDDRQDGDIDTLLAVLEEEGVEYTPARKTLYFIEDENGSWINTDVLVPSSAEELTSFISLRDETGSPISLPEEGALLNSNYTKYHDIEPGDTITVMDMNGERYSVQVAGVTEHYLAANQLVMSSAYYEKALGGDPESNTAYIKLGKVQHQALEERLSGEEGFLALRNDRVEWIATFKAHQSTTMLMVSIALILAVVMALMVLLNLNVVMINEKTTELIVMRINGFSTAAVKAYIYRDNIVLTLLGIILGVGVGLGLSAYVISSLSSESTYLITDPSLSACILGAAISGVFALITNLIALKRIERLRVSDISKL